MPQPYPVLFWCYSTATAFTAKHATLLRVWGWRESTWLIPISQLLGCHGNAALVDRGAGTTLKPGEGVANPSAKLELNEVNAK